MATHKSDRAVGAVTAALLFPRIQFDDFTLGGQIVSLLFILFKSRKQKKTECWK